MRTFGQILDTHKGFGPGFDFARIVLAFSVLLWHSPVAVLGQDNAALGPYLWIWYDSVLPMFFGLSGFLIAASARRLSLGNFLVNRGLRILPALAVEIVLSALVLGPILTTVPLRQYFTSAPFYTYFLNILGLVHYHLPGLFLDVPHADIVNVSLWTVPYEVVCYAVMSGLILTGWVKRGATMILLAAVIVAAATAYQAGFIPVTGFGKHALDMALLGQGAALLPSFLLGAAAYAIRYRIPYDRRIAVGCLAATVALSLAGNDGWWHVAALAAVMCPVFVYLVLFVGLTRIGRIPFFRRGDYSYGIYLYAFPIQQTLMLAYKGPWSIPAHMLVSAVAATGFAAFSWHCIEKPILGLRKSFSFMARKEAVAAEGDRPVGASPATLGIREPAALKGS